MTQTVLLFYKYVAVPDAIAERDAQLELCRSLDLKGRILVGEEGINGTVAGTPENCQAYMDAMTANPLYAGIEFKIDTTNKDVFPRLRVKARKEIVTLGVDVDPAQTAPRLSPEEFKDMLGRDDIVLFDARNNYESAIGRFEGAITPDIKLFKDLPAALDQYEDLKDKTIVTYCTGGIRCEKASALMRQKGFKDVYQLDGGIIKYAQTYPEGGFKGECFVFDGRMSVGFKDDAERLGACFDCDDPTNQYRNCSDPTCNKLILVCDTHNSPDVFCTEACELALKTLSATTK